jgi:hypothetical protein
LFRPKSISEIVAKWVEISMAREPIYLLPATDELSVLTDATAVKALEVIDNANRREHSYASLAMVCGTLGLMTCVLACAWLAETGHPQAGGLVLGTGVLAIVGQIINSRLNK